MKTFVGLFIVAGLLLGSGCASIDGKLSPEQIQFMARQANSQIPGSGDIILGLTGQSAAEKWDSESVSVQYSGSAKTVGVVTETTTKTSIRTRKIKDGTVAVVEPTAITGTSTTSTTAPASDENSDAIEDALGGIQ